MQSTGGADLHAGLDGAEIGLAGDVADPAGVERQGAVGAGPMIWRRGAVLHGFLSGGFRLRSWERWRGRRKSGLIPGILAGFLGFGP
jgi:hypothetical protein